MLIKSISPKEIGAINAILAQLGKLRGEKVEKAEKADLIRKYSAGRTDTTTGLWHHEAVQLINDLNAQCGNKPSDKPGEKQRRHIIAMAHEMNWQLPGGKIDMKKVNDWCIKYSYLHKELNAYEVNELPALVSQFKNVHKSFLNGV